MKNKKSKLVVLMLLCFALVLMTACGANNNSNSSSSTPSQNSSSQPSNESSTPDDSPKTIRLAAEAWMVERLHLEQAKTVYEAQNPNVTVEIVPYADPSVVPTFSLQWAQDKTDADIVIIDGISNAAQFLPRDLIINFNETNFFEGTTAKENFIGKSLSFGELEGNQFALPISLEAYAINANSKMFKEAGLTDADGKIIEPKDWNEIYEYAKKLTIKDGSTVVQQGMTIQWGPNALYTLMSTVKAEEGTYYGENGLMTFNHDSLREILQIWKKGVDEGVFSIDTFTSKDAGRNNYKAGQVAMLLESGSRAAEAVPTVGAENVTVFGAPNMSTNGSFGFAAGIVVPRASENIDLAVDFIKVALMAESVQAGMATDFGKLPVISSYYSSINADWKDTLHGILENSDAAPLYRDFSVLLKDAPVLIQGYLTGGSDLETLITNLEKSVSTAAVQ